MKQPSPLSGRAIALFIIIGLSAHSLMYRNRAHKLAIETSFINWAVPFLLLAGGYVLLKERNADIKYHKLISQDTEGVNRNIERRSQYILVVGWVFSAAGSICLIRVLEKVASR
jgi:hypothetical protein